jgi:NhaP-type Na+/H+ or K+/H+ antiporter
MIIGACLSPTDLVLAASVLAKSRFSDRVPSRIKNLSAFSQRKLERHGNVI